MRISLTEHHRSSRRIVAAGQLIRPKDPPLESVHGDGLHVRLAQCQTDEQEVRRHALRPATAHRAPHPRRASSQVSLVVHQLQMWRARGRAWREMCVLGFTKDSLTAFQQALEVVGVPVVLRNVEKKNEEGETVRSRTSTLSKMVRFPIISINILPNLQSLPSHHAERFRHVLFWEFSCLAWAVASCSSGPQAGGTP